MKALDAAEFTIIGTGLMGSSLALALHGKVKNLRGIDRDLAARNAATPCFDKITGDLSEAANSDVIILATPVRTILGLLESLKTLAKPGTLILDLGSSKQQIVQAMDSLPDHLLAVGGHPMAGKENSGPTSADGTLFKDRVFVLCPTSRSSADALVFAENMVRAIGAQPLTLSASRHDQAVASISHLPYTLSVALVTSVIQAAQADDTPWRLASSGFRDASRLAGSDTTMMGDTLLTNREAVLDALQQVHQQLDELESALQSSDEERLRAILETAKHARSDWFQHWNRSLL
jgi:prephenate dehydrogenase